jgi:hypothetical protein
MKKITMLLVAVALVSGAAFAQEKACCKKKGEKCTKDMACCKDKKNCSKDSKDCSKDKEASATKK